jgi:hypothetical protein
MTFLNFDIAFIFLKFERIRNFAKKISKTTIAKNEKFQNLTKFDETIIRGPLYNVYALGLTCKY